MSKYTAYSTFSAKKSPPLRTVEETFFVAYKPNEENIYITYNIFSVYCQAPIKLYYHYITNKLVFIPRPSCPITCIHKLNPSTSDNHILIPVT